MNGARVQICHLKSVMSKMTNEKFQICNDQFPFLRVLYVLCGCFFLFAATASAAPQVVVPLEGEPFSGQLVSIDAGSKATFRIVERETAGVAATVPATRTVALDELVRWGHPLSPRPQTIVVLSAGGQLVTAADWSGDAAVRLEGEEFIVLSDTFGEVRLPRAVVRGCVFAQREHPDDRARLVEKARSASGDSDAVWLTNQDRLSGTLTELARGSLTMETDAGEARLPLSRVEAVVLKNGQQSSAVSRQSGFVVGLRDGSLLFADAVRASENDLNLEFFEGMKLAGGRADDVVFVQSLRGRFEYVSDLEAANYRHVPYLRIEWPYKRDSNVFGEPLIVGGKRTLKGIGMHSASRLTYRLERKYQRFEAAIAVDDSADGRGSVTFGVYVLRGGAWQDAYRSGIVRGGDVPLPISVDLDGAEGLTLTVDYADRGDEMDRADWLDARLVE
jgi:hypothetical protein